MFKGGPEPLDKEINEILGSKREDRFSNPFFELVRKNVRFVFCTLHQVRGCTHLGYRLRAYGICPIPCANPFPKSPLRASVKMAFLVSRINVPKDLCVHPFRKWPLRAIDFKSPKTTFGSEHPQLCFLLPGVFISRFSPSFPDLKRIRYMQWDHLNYSTLCTQQRKFSLSWNFLRFVHLKKQSGDSR